MGIYLQGRIVNPRAWGKFKCHELVNSSIAPKLAANTQKRVKGKNIATGKMLSMRSKKSESCGLVESRRLV
jgi:hypothetical protein